ncbi:hydroxyproline-rich glycoprotein-like [Anaeramoeba flamelloides]|uniref:Hydroxyproline-rich glycoprotein-like n=1 Tax=Anaeramoeba flamelloides TaxID=1746091 RepID=A0ABQ8XIS8_9EUKA|nr:hydroxyproline-rich glycoprotein-like [Anaeramoeba flamelloides]
MNPNRSTKKIIFKEPLQVKSNLQSNEEATRKMFSNNMFDANSSILNTEKDIAAYEKGAFRAINNSIIGDQEGSNNKENIDPNINQLLFFKDSMFSGGLNKNYRVPDLNTKSFNDQFVINEGNNKKKSPIKNHIMGIENVNKTKNQDIFPEKLMISLFDNKKIEKEKKIEKKKKRVKEKEKEKEKRYKIGKLDEMIFNFDQEENIIKKKKEKVKRKRKEKEKENKIRKEKEMKKISGRGRGRRRGRGIGRGRGRGRGSWKGGGRGGGTRIKKENRKMDINVKQNTDKKTKMNQITKKELNNTHKKKITDEIIYKKNVPQETWTREIMKKLSYEKTKLVDLNRELKINFRRSYDIVGVLSSLGILSKKEGEKSKNATYFYGIDKPVFQDQESKDIEVCKLYDQIIEEQNRLLFIVKLMNQLDILIKKEEESLGTEIR